MENVLRQLIAGHVLRVLLQFPRHGGDPMKLETNLMQVVAKYNTDDKCRETLAHLRWPDKVTCLKCKSDNVAPVHERKVHVCYSCRYQFSATVNTIFHDSHLPLTTWFFVTYLMTESRKG